MGIFSGLRFFFLSADADKAKAAASAEGAEIAGYHLEDPTHIIAESVDAHEITEAKDCLGSSFSVVKSSWILFSVKAKKLLPTKCFSPEPGQLFSNCTLCISEIGDHDAALIWTVVESNGGRCVRDFDGRVTHLICGKATGNIYRLAMESPEVKIATPDWLISSLRNSSLLNVADFHPDLLNSEERSSQPIIDPTDESLFATLDSLVPSDFEDLLNAAPSSSSVQTPVPPVDTHAMDLNASISAVLNQAKEAQKKAEMEGSNSRPSSGTDSNSQGSTGSDSLNPNKMLPAQQSPSALVRPQTKTALAKLLNTRSNGACPGFEPNLIVMPPGTPHPQNMHQVPPPQHTLVSMPSQTPVPAPMQVGQPHPPQMQQQQWQWKQQQEAQQQQHVMQQQNLNMSMAGSPVQRQRMMMQLNPQQQFQQQQQYQMYQSNQMQQSPNLAMPSQNIPVQQQQHPHVMQPQNLPMQQQAVQIQHNPQMHMSSQMQPQQMMPQQQQQQMQYQPQSHHPPGHFAVPQQQQQAQQQHQQQMPMHSPPNPQQRPMQQVHPGQMQQQMTMGYAQQSPMQQSMQMRQPPPYQQVIQRPMQQQVGGPQHQSQQRMDMTQQMAHFSPPPVTAAGMMDASGVPMDMMGMQQQHHQQQQQLHQQVPMQQVPMQMQPHQQHQMQQQHQLIQQQDPQSHMRPMMMDPRLQGVQARPVLQTQLSSGGMAAPPRPPAPPKELVYYATDCPSVPPLKFLSGCKFVLSDVKDFSDMNVRTLKHIEMNIKKYGGQVLSIDSLSSATHLVCETTMNPLAQSAKNSGKRVVTPYWLNDCYRKAQMLPPWRFAHLPTMFGENNRPLKGKIVTVTGFHEDEREDVIALLLTLGVKYQPFLDKEVFVVISKSNTGKKYEKAREWGIPCVNVDWVHEVWQGDLVALTVMDKDPKYIFFNFDAPLNITNINKLPPALMHAWTVPIPIPQEQQVKLIAAKPGRPINPQNPKKRMKKLIADNECKKKRKLGPVVLLFDGVEKTEEHKLTKSLKPLGVSVTEKFHVCTHLVVPRVARTPKFLIAFNTCRYIVSPKWIDDCVVANQLLEPDQYIPHDEASELADSFSLREAVERKNALLQEKGQLFGSVIFFVSPRVYPQVDTLAEIVGSAGGKVVRHRLPKADEIKMHGRSGTFYAVIATLADHKDLSGLLKIGFPVYSVDLVFSSIIKQRIDWGCCQIDFSGVQSSTTVL